MSKSVYTYKQGVKDGIPIALAYLFVSTGFGVTAVNYGIPIIGSVLISLTNLTSAGQVAGIEIIRDCSVLIASALEMALTQLVINLRYSLMGISLSQKLDESFTPGARLLTSFVITDEIFAVCSTRHGDISKGYMLGVATLPMLGWTLGTAIGAVAASLIPSWLAAILSISLYGMFLSIFLPGVKRGLGSKLSIGLSIVLSVMLYYLPCFAFISSGFRIMICAIASSCVAALVDPNTGEYDEGGGQNA